MGLPGSSEWRRDRDSNPGRLLHLAGFKTSAFNRSAIPPAAIVGASASVYI